MEKEYTICKQLTTDKLKILLNKIDVDANVYICIESDDDKEDELVEVTDVLIGYEGYSNYEYPHIILKASL